MSCISDLLSKNQTIQKLNLKGNPIILEKDLHALYLGLTQNISLVELQFDHELMMLDGCKKQINLIEKQIQLNKYIGKEILPSFNAKKQQN